jgi:hypothetical protein
MFKMNRMNRVDGAKEIRLVPIHRVKTNGTPTEDSRGGVDLRPDFTCVVPFTPPNQKENRTPSWICRFGRAEVKPSGWLGDSADVPCTLNVVNPCPPAASGRPKPGPT